MMPTIINRSFLGSLMVLVFGAASARAADYQVVAHYPVGGETGYDYLRVDPVARRLYIAHGSQIEVLDVDTGIKIGRVGPTKGAHGIALIPALNRGFATSGSNRTVLVFDPKTLEVVKVINGLGVKPDAIEYDEETKRIYVANGTSGGISVIDPQSAQIVATIALPGKLEGLVFDGKGRLFVNTEDKSMVQVVDTHALKSVASWAIAPVEGGTGLAIDREHHRLFVAGGNNLLAVVDSDSGAIVATPAIGEDPDGDAFDPASGLIFTSNVAGTISVLHEDAPDKYSAVQTVTTAYGARTIAWDQKTGRLFVCTGQFEPAPKPTADVPEPRRKMTPGTFEVLAIGR